MPSGISGGGTRLASMQATATLPHVDELPRPRVRYFSGTGCVVERGDWRDVFIGGWLISTFHIDDAATRNVAIIAVTRERRVRVGKLAQALGIHPDTVRAVRRRFEQGGLKAVLEQRPGGPKRVRTKQLLARLYGLFEQGATIDQAHSAIRKRVSRAVVGRIHQQWADEREEASAALAAALAPVALPASPANDVTLSSAPPPARSGGSGHEAADPEDEAEADDAPETSERQELPLETAIAHGGQRVQHLGSWIMLAMLGLLGLYRYAEHLRAEAARALAEQGRRMVGAAALRLALDAAAIALTLGQGCIEGVRRIATPSAPTLLRSQRPISETWTRRVLGRFAQQRGELLHLTQLHSLVRAGYAEEEARAVFYVDNHLRPYTGKFTIRKGWRMQDKRARPGISDYYIHDQNGRPLLRVDDPTNQSLTRWLLPIGQLLRDALGGPAGPTPLLVFDRGGAFPKQMAELRDAEFEFVTYERAPYPLLAPTAFDQSLKVGPETIEFTERRLKNLGHGRGRVRRISLRTQDGHQVNVLAVGQAPAEQLIRWLLGRWPRQENQFKHGVERWGGNQLDSHQVEPYDPEAIIPNPARRRLDRNLRLARAAEGAALRKLSRLAADAPARAQLEQNVRDARELQQQLEAQRPLTRKHLPVNETELASKLVKHPRPYKMLIDTVRIALANAESELAARLGPHLPKPKQAKKTLANLLAAPGQVRLGKSTIRVTLEPAGTPSEAAAFRVLLRQLNAMDLRLPGDPSRRKLRFQIRMHGDAVE
jgi:hypothetical protein